MHIKRLSQLIYLAILPAATSCDAQVATSESAPFQVSHPGQFSDYWYGGKAEINRYELTQMRYGEERKGDAVMIFVTEDFLIGKQVKKEFGEDKAISVLKVNFQKKFITGIYDYAIMTSVFTPIQYRENPATLKVTFSAQDWCGQSFGQMNLRGGNLNFQTRSYFQAEGDVDISLPATYVEEDIWTRMRLEPQMLPLGKIDMVPSQEYLRLYHQELKPYKAEASLVLQVKDEQSGGKEFYVYTLKFPNLSRILKVTCESRFPFKILQWEETIGGSKDEALTTTALLTKTMTEAYWQQNDKKNEVLRDSLGLRYQMVK